MVDVQSYMSLNEWALQGAVAEEVEEAVVLELAREVVSPNVLLLAG